MGKNEIAKAFLVTLLLAAPVPLEIFGQSIGGRGGPSGVGGSAYQRDVHIVPFASSPAGSPVSGATFTGGWTVTNRAGANNVGAALQATPSIGATLYFEMELPASWSVSSQPYIRIQYASGSNMDGGTVIWTAASACTKSDGSVTDDPAFSAEAAFPPQSMTVANVSWAQAGSFTQITSGNNCVAGSPIIFRLQLSGTALSAINAYQAVVTIPILPSAWTAE